MFPPIRAIHVSNPGRKGERDVSDSTLRQVAQLSKLSFPELQERWGSLFGGEPPAYHRRFLVSRPSRTRTRSPSNRGSIPTASTNRTSRTPLCPSFVAPSLSHIPPTARVLPRLDAFACSRRCGREPCQIGPFHALSTARCAMFLRQFRPSASPVHRRRAGWVTHRAREAWVRLPLSARSGVLRSV